jgi:hypothetical protein
MEVSVHALAALPLGKRPPEPIVWEVGNRTLISRSSRPAACYYTRGLFNDVHCVALCDMMIE